MTLKLCIRTNIRLRSFGTILNNMTLKHQKESEADVSSFGTILNNMTLKPRRIIFSP